MSKFLQLKRRTFLGNRIENTQEFLYMFGEESSLELDLVSSSIVKFLIVLHDGSPVLAVHAALGLC